MTITNAISVDLEDWFCVANFRGAIPPEHWDGCELRVGASTRRLLGLFTERRVKATFFVLGWIAERLPDLVREIEDRGHEVATHGYSHRLLTDMSPEDFAADLDRALEVTARCAGQPVLGFRAPSFTLTAQTLWAVPILLEYGIKYDSSVFPLSFHPDYGMPTAPLAPYRLDGGLIEVPLTCVELGRVRVPCSGGGYFRLFPYALTRHLLRRCNDAGRPVVFYLHPWEVDPAQPRVDVRWDKRFRHYYNLDRTLTRLERLLTDFDFTSIGELIGLSPSDARPWQRQPSTLPI